MRYTILHDIPGRLRVRSHGQPIGSRVRIELDRWVAAHPCILSARFTVRTRSLLVTYRRDCEKSLVLGHLDDLSLPEVAVIGPDAAQPVRHLTALDAFVRAVRKELVHFLSDIVIPKPIRRVHAAVAVSRRATAMTTGIIESGPARGLYSLARMAILFCAHASLPLRIALQTVFALLEQVLFPPETLLASASGIDQTRQTLRSAS